MKKIIYFIIIGLPIICSAQGNDIYYSEIPNFFNAYNSETIFKAEISYVLGNKQIQASYNISDKYFIYGTYNYDKSTSKNTSLFGDVIFDENRNSGYSFGFGHQNFGQIGHYNNLEVLIGFEKQNNSVTSYFSSKKISLTDKKIISMNPILKYFLNLI